MVILLRIDTPIGHDQNKISKGEVSFFMKSCGFEYEYKIHCNDGFICLVVKGVVDMSGLLEILEDIARHRDFRVTHHLLMNFLEAVISVPPKDIPVLAEQISKVFPSKGRRSAIVVNDYRSVALSLLYSKNNVQSTLQVFSDIENAIEWLTQCDVVSLEFND
ncbi:MAG: hypothetical protein MI748_17875 [Opitutales bacterium]|nr:hypothetical protein [Opitutales bacterium]